MDVVISEDNIRCRGSCSVKYLDNEIEIKVPLTDITGADYCAVTRVTSGAATGKIDTLTYKDDGTSGEVLAVVTFTYDANGYLESIGVV